MREPLIETFAIPTTYNDFRNWITSYGLFKHEFITADMQYQPGVLTWWHHLEKGSAIFRAKIEQPELLNVTAELVTRYLAGDDGIERWILDDEPILMENFKELVEAIRAKYPQSNPNATDPESLSPKQKIKSRVLEADKLYRSNSDEWWRYILEFQNTWNESNPRSNRITNIHVGSETYTSEGTVRNKRSELGLSEKRVTKDD